MDNITQDDMRKARNKYFREWRAKNKEKTDAYREKFWLKKALEDAREPK